MTNKVELEEIRDSYLSSNVKSFPLDAYESFMIYHLIESAINVLPDEKLKTMTPDEVIIYAAAAVFGGVNKGEDT